MKFKLLLFGIAVMGMLVFVGCNKNIDAPAAPTGNAVEVSDADLDAGVNELNDLESLDAENDALLADTNLDQLALE